MNDSSDTRQPVEGWTPLPTWMLRDSDLTANEILVLMVLMSRTNAAGVCWPSQKTIAAEARMSESTAKRTLLSLRAKNLVSWEQRKKDDGSLGSSVYRTHLENARFRWGHGEPTLGSERPHPGVTVTEEVDPEELDPLNQEKHHVDADAPTPLRQDVEALCDLLADLIEQNGSKRPVVTKTWRDAARRLLDLDGRTVEQVGAAIRWCQGDEFWRANILSMPTLRKQYDRLRLDAHGRRGARWTGRGNSSAARWNASRRSRLQEARRTTCGASRS